MFGRQERLEVPPAHREWGSRYWPGLLVLLLCALTVILGYWIIQAYPVIYWYDPYMRLAHRDQLIVGRWLPGVQAVIVVLGRLTPDLSALRLALAAVAAGAVLAAYLLAARLFNQGAGLSAAALLASNTMFVGLATVPYPEVLFIALVLLALFFLDEPPTPRRRLAGALCLNLACLTRYEGWLLAAVMIGSSILGPLRAKDWGTAAKTAATFGLAPAGWIALGALLVEPRESAILPRLTLDHWWRFAAQFLDLLNWQAGLGILLLGLAGLVGAGWGSPKRATHRRIAAFLGLDVLVIGLLQPWQFGNLRQTFVVLVFLIVYAAYALERLAGGLLGMGRLRRVSLAGVVGLAAWLSWQDALAFVAGAASEPDIRAPAAVGRWLKTQALGEARVLVLADHAAQPYVIAVYSGLPLDRVADLGQACPATVERELRSAPAVYVAAVHRDTAALSPAAAALVEKLEAGPLPPPAMSVDWARVWVLKSGMGP
jgi:hypothetical protein